MDDCPICQKPSLITTVDKEKTVFVCYDCLIEWAPQRIGPRFWKKHRDSPMAGRGSE